MSHDLHDFMQQLGQKMDAEYARIRKSSKHDPGTAGDEGEENWAQLLRDWLPTGYQVVTKGQLLDETGSLSPQVDVLVLKPWYPPALHHKKKYLFAGVAAAFECKLTLRNTEIRDIVGKAAILKRMGPRAEGTPYKELSTSPLFGLLAHSHGGRAARAIDGIDSALAAADVSFVEHPREMIDLVCVANLATWSASKQPLDDLDESESKGERIPTTSYMCHSGPRAILRDDFEHFNPIGLLLSELLIKLAWKDSSLRELASYFLGVEFSRSAVGKVRHWDKSVYSKALRRKLTPSRLKDVIDWDEWASSIQ